VGSVFRDTGPSLASNFGMGIRVTDGGSLDVVESVVANNEVVGAGPWHAGSRLRLVRSVVRDTVGGGWADTGFGVEAKGGSEAEVLGCLIDRNYSNGIYSQKPGSTVEVAGTLVRDTDTKAGTAWGQGVAAAEGGVLTAFRSVLEGNAGAGAITRFEDGELTLYETTVRESKVDSGGGLGIGVYVGVNSTISVLESLIERCHDSGAASMQEGAVLLVEGSVIRDTQVTEYGMFGDGVRVDYGGSASLWQSVIEANRYAGVSVLNTGSSATLDEVVIRGTFPDEHDGKGYGLIAQEEVVVEARNCLIENNTHDGVGSLHNGPLLILEDSIVRDTQLYTDKLNGFGVRAWAGGRIEMKDCLVEGNHSTGVAAQMEGSSLLADNVVVRGTVPNGMGQFGFGMSAVEGAQLEATGCLLEGNTTSEVAASWPDTIVDVKLSLIRSAPGHSAATSWTTGARAAEEATLKLSYCTLENNSLAGLTTFHEGTHALVERCLIRRTRPGYQGSSGVGIHGEPGAHIEVNDTLLDENHYIGMYIYGKDTTAQVRRSVIRRTLPGDSGEHGDGLAVQNGASLSIEASIVRDNRTTGVAVFHPSSTASLQDSLVAGTLEGGAEVYRDGKVETQVFGDGVLASEGAHAVIANSLVMGNARCGAYIADSSATIAGNTVVGNSSFGLAMESCADKVSYEGLANLFAGNGSALPAAMAAEVTDSPKGLPVPPPPFLPDSGGN